MANAAAKISTTEDAAEPYEEELPNATTIASDRFADAYEFRASVCDGHSKLEALEEAERIARDPTVKRYSDVEEALAALKA